MASMSNLAMLVAEDALIANPAGTLASRNFGMVEPS